MHSISLLFCIFIQFISVKCFVIDQAYISVWLSAAAYCGKDNYQSMILDGPATGFIVKNIIYDSDTDLQGFIGILPSTQNIYVVFRGSSSVKNWVEDFEIKKVEYTTFPECNCSVHKGFYDSTLHILNDALYSIYSLLKTYHYDIIVTGHSYGAAVCQLFSMELLAKNIQSQVYNFGQPRVGDMDFAYFVNDHLFNLWRFTHNKDLVPHIPPSTGFEYFHSCREIFQDGDNNTIFCSNIDCEDPNCSQQYRLVQTNTDDHHIYLRHIMECETSVHYNNYISNSIQLINFNIYTF